MPTTPQPVEMEMPKHAAKTANKNISGHTSSAFGMCKALARVLAQTTRTFHCMCMCVRALPRPKDRNTHTHTYTSADDVGPSAAYACAHIHFSRKFRCRQTRCCFGYGYRFSPLSHSRCVRVCVCKLYSAFLLFDRSFVRAPYV